MQLKIQLFAGFREAFHGKELVIDLKDGHKVRDLLGVLCDSYHSRDIFFENDKLKKYIVILINGRHIQHLDGLDTDLSEGDTVALFPPAGGG